ncbi:phosphate regulon sensor histidine kinase PhoR [Marinobacterium weihaiense]|uniref:Phosphate regulon sensor protein PhoR n=1 Tax=Marinobacterium weihaiense TaxID=2851016 RepID=A0ABS6MAB8_9GAMM|nr:phosphate regulon sensor histidine kinase PhoR [Marinobacterium weihaiense]MBV0933232.1 phosphate regulon sensor histidine kinase PhoR [Marinobacterium weihaiense]
MHVTRHALLISLLLLATAGLIAGALFGHAMVGLSAGLLIWGVQQIRSFNRLSDWLHREDGSEPPEAGGAWGDLFDELARLQKRSRAREQHLRGIISRFQQSSAALSDAIVIIDSHHNLEWWNRSADRLLGLKATSDRGKPLMNLLRDPRFVRYFRKGHYQEPLELPSPVNSDLQLQYQITKFGEGDRLLVARDITRLLRLEQTRQDFVANASHELRTPLTVIRGYLETFLDQELPRPLQRGLGQMQQQARRMESLVTDLLLLSRLEASQHISDEHPILIHSLIRQIHEDGEALATGRGHHFVLELDSEYDLLGQENELRSAFSNLVFNAVRYTPDNGTITLRWQVDSQGGHFSVSDDGIGIEPMHLPRLTERFYRIDESRSSASGGTGLGLAIVKHVLMRHGAHLSIDSTPGEGSTFTCHFTPDMVVPVRETDAG